MATMDLRGSAGTLRLSRNGGNATIRPYIGVGPTGPASTAPGPQGPQGSPGPQGPQGLPGANSVPTDTAVAGYINSASATKDALSGALAKGPLPALELVGMTAFGNSWANGGNGSTNGARYWDRIASRNRTKPIVNLGVSGTQSDQILAQIIANWTPNQQGLVGLGDIVLNDLRHWGTDTDRVTTRECFRSMLARLNAWSVQSTASASLIYGPGWANGTSDATAGRFVDVAWTGPVVNIRVGCVTTAGATVTVKDAGTGTTVATFTTGGYKAAFEGVIRLTGYSAGTHTVRVSTSAAATISGAIVPMPNPPLVVWFKAGPVTEKGAIAPARTALYLSECASILSGYSNVIPVDVGTGWDDASMVYQGDGLHPNDKGHGYIADRIQSALLAQGFTQGLNSLAGVDAGAYAPPTPAYTAPGATAPAQVTGFTATNGNQVSFTWTTPSDGGATLTGYTLESSPAGAGTWTTLASPAASATSFTATTGLTANSSYDFRLKAVNSVGSGTPSATSTATAGVAPVTYASDTFTRADSPTLGSTEVGGYAWTMESTAASSASIVGNQANVNSGTDNTLTGVVTVDDGHADGTFQLTMATNNNNTRGIYFRGGANVTTSGLIFWWNGASYALAVRTSQSAYTQVGTGSTQQRGTDDVLKVICVGTSIKCYVNGTLLYTYTDSRDTAGTKHGLWHGAGTGRTLDNFSHTSLTA